LGVSAACPDDQRFPNLTREVTSMPDKPTTPSRGLLLHQSLERTFGH
jgi:hypothetical protein